MKRLLCAAVLAFGCSTSAPPGAPGTTDPNPLVVGLQITKVAAYQGLKSTLMQDGVAYASEVPLVQGRHTLFRVWLTPAAGWDGHEVIVRLVLSAGGTDRPPLDVHKQVTAASTEDDLDSTANFDVPADQITADLGWSVSVREVAAGRAPADAPNAIYPDVGGRPLGARDTGVTKVVLIPIQYNADGSGRMPDTSSVQIDKLRAKILALYPIRDVDISVGDPLAWSKSVAASGQGWGTLLDAVVRRRAQDGVARNVYYYGMFSPASSMEEFCGQGCVAGLSPVSDNPDDEYARGSIGLGFLDPQADAAGTFVHEVGHAHGRQHAPCDTMDADIAYPYDNGKIGDWGYSFSRGKLIDPNGTARDMMGYCDPIWISDYTYNAIFERTAYLNTTANRLVGEAKRYHTVVVDGDTLLRSGTVALRGAPGQAHSLERAAAGGVEQVPARFYPFDHLPGGILLIPEDADVGALKFRGHAVP
jgi:hypothetical protein